MIKKTALIALVLIAGAILVFVMFSKKSSPRLSVLKIDSTEDYEALGFPGQRKIVGDNNNLYIAYRKKLNGYYQIFVATIKGKSVSKSNVAFIPNDQRVPSLAFDNMLHIVWYGSEDPNEKNSRQIKYANSKDGKKWNQWKDISYVDGYDGGEYWQEHPFILADKNLYVVWEGRDIDNSFQQIKFSKSKDNGESWTSWRNINPTYDIPQSRPVIIKSNNVLHVFMYSSLDKVSQIWHSYSNDDGDTWSDWQNISNSNSDSRHLSASICGKNICIVWRAGEPSQIFLSELINGSWSKPKNISSSRNYCFFPVINDRSVSWMEADSSGFPSDNPLTGSAFVFENNSKMFLGDNMGFPNIFDKYVFYETPFRGEYLINLIYLP